MHLETFITEVYCLVDDFMKEPRQWGWQRQRGPRPQLSDSEVLTMEVVGEFLGYDTDKGTWEYFSTHHDTMFPRLGCRTSYIRQAANLWAYKKALQQRLATALGAQSDNVHFVDGLPLPVAGFSHARGSRVFPGQVAYGKKGSQTYYGFRGALLINLNGVITDFALSAADVGERHAMWDIVDNVQGLLIADRGYAGTFHRDELARKGIEFRASLPKHHRETAPLPPRWEKKLRGLRRLIETVIGQLSERLHFQRIRARDMWHLTNRLWRKLLAHTMAIFLNHTHHRPLLQFDGLISR